MARLRSRRPRCPRCARAVPRARVRCQHCGHDLVDPSRCAAWARVCDDLVTRLLAEPWLASGRLLSYGMRSTERGFLRRHHPRLRAQLGPLVTQIRRELSEPASTLLLEYLRREVVLPRSPVLARCFAACACEDPASPQSM